MWKAEQNKKNTRDTGGEPLMFSAGLSVFNYKEKHEMAKFMQARKQQNHNNKNNNYNNNNHIMNNNNNNNKYT